MNTQIVSRYPILRTARRLLPALYLAIAIVACSLMSFASPAAWADVQEDFRLWENVTTRGNFGFLNPDLKRWR
ncbi:MAG TPA: hypothetical protein VK901_05510 [Nitrospiraceae bacterium]|nr:hypothetical protein [Nitrospiraceae bacterium]